MLRSPDSGGGWKARIAQSALSVAVVGVLTTTVIHLQPPYAAEAAAAPRAVETVASATDGARAGVLKMRPSPVPAQASSVAKQESLAVAPAKVRPQLIQYVVQPGDTLWSLAAKVGSDVASIAAANGLSEASLLHPGQTLLLPNFAGAVVTVQPGDTLGALAARYQVSVETITQANPGAAGGLQPGMRLLIPGGRATFVAASAQRASVQSSRRTLAAAAAGILASAARLVLRLPYPGPITSPFGQRARDFHTGVDIGAPYGAPIRAAGPGVVIYAGWDGGYGRLIAIRHDNGVVTRYAHASRILVSVGQRVSAGQVIGRVGESGLATGPHIHFEVIVDGRFVNPLTVVGG
ncbi:MAG: M23 family metallopeptidase [Clostridia bacterium]|nr:M23 family metallopeptidase [Clostridia bacterium]